MGGRLTVQTQCCLSRSDEDVEGGEDSELADSCLHARAVGEEETCGAPPHPPLRGGATEGRESLPRSASQTTTLPADLTWSQRPPGAARP